MALRSTAAPKKSCTVDRTSVDLLARRRSLTRSVCTSKKVIIECRWNGFVSQSAELQTISIGRQLAASRASPAETIYLETWTKKVFCHVPYCRSEAGCRAFREDFPQEMV
jgi:hypothetical protein